MNTARYLKMGNEVGNLQVYLGKCILTQVS